MTEPKHLTMAEQTLIVKKLLDMFRLPPLIRYLKIEWSIDQGLVIESEHYPDSSLLSSAKALKGNNHD